MSLKIIHDKLREVTECSIHLGQIQEPKILPCGHSFCLRCIQQCLKVGVVECPLDRTRHKVDNARKLPTNYAVVDWLAMIGDMKTQQVDVWAEIESVQKNFDESLRACDDAIGQLQNCVKSVEEIKANLIKKHDSIENSFTKAQSSTLIDESKDHAMANLLYTCNLMEKMCLKQIGPAFEYLSTAVLRIKDVSQVTNTMDIIDFKLKPDNPMHEGKVCQSIITITETLLKETRDLLHNPKKFAELLASEIKQKFGNHLWTVIVGYANIKLSVRCTDDDYISLTMGDRKIIVYRSNRSPNVSNKSASIIKQFAANELQNFLKQKFASSDNLISDGDDNDKDVQAEKKLRLALAKKFSGDWHAVSWEGSKNGVVYCTGNLKNYLEMQFNNGRIYCAWQCLDI